MSEKCQEAPEEKRGKKSSQEGKKKKRKKGVFSLYKIEKDKIVDCAQHASDADQDISWLTMATDILVDTAVLHGINPLKSEHFKSRECINSDD
jgi:hypothetical protein